MSCKHEKICQQCIREEIKKHENAIAELKKKLASNYFITNQQQEYHHDVSLQQSWIDTKR